MYSTMSLLSCITSRTVRYSYYVVFYTLFLFQAKIFSSTFTVETALLQAPFPEPSNTNFFALVEKHVKHYHDLKKTFESHYHNTESTDVANFLTHLEYYYCAKNSKSEENQGIKIYPVKIEKNTENILDASLIPKELAKHDIGTPFTIKTLLMPLYLASVSQNYPENSCEEHLTINTQPSPLSNAHAYFEKLNTTDLLTFFINYDKLTINIDVKSNLKPFNNNHGTVIISEYILELLIKRLILKKNLLHLIKGCLGYKKRYKQAVCYDIGSKNVNKIAEAFFNTQYGKILKDYRPNLSDIIFNVLMYIQVYNKDALKIKVENGCLDLSGFDLTNNSFIDLTYASNYDTNLSSDNLKLIFISGRWFPTRKQIENQESIAGGVAVYVESMAQYHEITTLNLSENPKLKFNENLWNSIHETFPNITLITADPETIQNDLLFLQEQSYSDFTIFLHHLTDARQVITRNREDGNYELHPQKILSITPSKKDPQASKVLERIYKKAYRFSLIYRSTVYVKTIATQITNIATYAFETCIKIIFITLAIPIIIIVWPPLLLFEVSSILLQKSTTLIGKCIEACINACA